MAKICDTCKGDRDIRVVRIETSTGFVAEAEQCSDCIATLPKAIQDLGFTEAPVSGLGTAGK